MNAEQRAALERLRTGPIVYVAADHVTLCWEQFSDLIAAKDVALSSHPADDGEAVTVEWLLGLGFTRRMCGRMGIDFAMGVLMDDGGDPENRCWIIAGENGGPIPRFDSVVNVLKNPTKGQVRKLLKVLKP